MASIVHLSEGANLALHAVMRLAQDPHALLDTRSLAGELGGSVAHLSKVLQRLQRAGILASVRGPAGGFRLARPPADVTLLQVYELIEGPLEIRDCLLDTPMRCPGHCLFGDFLRSTGTRFRDLMTRTTLADLMGAGRAVPPSHGEAVPAHRRAPATRSTTTARSSTR
jgi:Rrf2 family protein